MATMDDLIAMAGQLHMSQEALDLNSFKAQLARTLVLPMPIPTSTTGSSLASDAPLPSPTSCGSFDAFPFPAPSQGSPTPAYQYQEDDAALAAAFAGDAFAPMVQQKQDPWSAFRPSSFQAPPPQYQPPPQYTPQQSQQQDAMDADMAEAML